MVKGRYVKAGAKRPAGMKAQSAKTSAKKGGEKPVLYKKLLAMKLDSGKIKQHFGGKTLSQLTLDQLKTLHSNASSYKKAAKKSPAKKARKSPAKKARKSPAKKSPLKKAAKSAKKAAKAAKKTASELKLVRSACPSKLTATRGKTVSTLTLKAATKGSKECHYNRDGKRA